MSKSKKSKQKISGQEEDKMYESFGFFDYEVSKPLTVESIQKVSHFIENYKVYDIEGLHILEDTIMKIFIDQLSENLYPKSQIVKISKEILKLNEAVNKIGRWYA